MKLLKLFVMIVFVALVSCNKQSGVTVDPCDAQNQQITALQGEVTELKVQNATLQGELDCLETKTPVKKKLAVSTEILLRREIDKLKKDLANCKKGVVTKSAPVAKKVTKQATSTPLASRANAVAGKANLDYLREGGEIIFCARANGREDCYFPHYAMNHGVVFNRFSDNQVKGYNWKVEPTDYYEGDYGITVDGTFYVSDDMVTKSLQAGGLRLEENLEIKSPYTGWKLKPMVLEDGFWLYRTQ